MLLTAQIARLAGRGKFLVRSCDLRRVMLEMLSLVVSIALWMAGGGIAGQHTNTTLQSRVMQAVSASRTRRVAQGAGSAARLTVLHGMPDRMVAGTHHQNWELCLRTRSSGRRLQRRERTSALHRYCGSRRHGLGLHDPPTKTGQDCSLREASAESIEPNPSKPCHCQQ